MNQNFTNQNTNNVKMNTVKKKKKIDILKLPKLFKNLIFPYLNGKALFKYRQCCFQTYETSFNEMIERQFQYLNNYRPLQDERYFILKKNRLEETIATRKIQIQSIAKKISILEPGIIKDKQKTIKSAVEQDMKSMNKQLDDILYGLNDYKLIFRQLSQDLVHDPSNNWDLNYIQRNKHEVQKDTSLYLISYTNPLSRNKPKSIRELNNEHMLMLETMKQKQGQDLKVVTMQSNENDNVQVYDKIVEDQEQNDHIHENKMLGGEEVLINTRSDLSDTTPFGSDNKNNKVEIEKIRSSNEIIVEKKDLTKDFV